jgi:hypothetical protein
MRMGLLDRIFGQKPQDAPPERIGESVATMEQYAQYYGALRTGEF